MVDQASTIHSNWAFTASVWCLQHGDVEKSIRLGTAWARLESNNERLWAKIADDVQAFLKSLWEVGALSGRTPEEAYFVRCDRTTMTWEDIHNGRAIVVIGLNMVQGSDAVPRTLVIQTGPPRR